MKSKADILFFIYFYVAWFVCVLAGRNQDSLVSLVLPIPALAFAIWKQKVSGRVLARALILSCVGIGFDVLAHRAGWISFESGSVPNQEHLWSILPIWLLSLWFLYMAYLPTLAEIFRGRLMVGFALGSVFGPLSYLSGEKFDLLYFAGKQEILNYSVFWGFHFLTSIALLRNFSSTTQSNRKTNLESRNK